MTGGQFPETTQSLPVGRSAAMISSLLTEILKKFIYQRSEFPKAVQTP